MSGLTAPEAASMHRLVDDAFARGLSADDTIRYIATQFGWGEPPNGVLVSLRVPGLVPHRSSE